MAMDNFGDAINIKFGTTEEWDNLPKHEQNPNDIIFFEDTPLIRTRGKVYGGNGIPTWSGESKAFSDPTKLFKELYSSLKRPLYMADKNCPKFDIYINEEFKSIYERNGADGTVMRHDKWVLTQNDMKIYKMIYSDALTEYQHFTRKGTPGHPIVFTFPVLEGCRFQIHKCCEDDWLSPAGEHDRKCPVWNNKTQDYACMYNIDYVSPESKYRVEDDGVTVRGALIADDTTNTIKCMKSGTVIVTHKKGAYTTVNGSYRPQITISFEE